MAPSVHALTSEILKMMLREAAKKALWQKELFCLVL